MWHHLIETAPRMRVGARSFSEAASLKVCQMSFSKPSNYPLYPIESNRGTRDKQSNRHPPL